MAFLGGEKAPWGIYASIVHIPHTTRPEANPSITLIQQRSRSLQASLLSTFQQIRIYPGNPGNRHKSAWGGCKELDSVWESNRTINKRYEKVYSYALV